MTIEEFKEIYDKYTEWHINMDMEDLVMRCLNSLGWREIDLEKGVSQHDA